jgi:capsid protein
VAKRGYDAEQVDAEIAADQAREKSLGLSFRTPAASAPLPGEPGDPSSAEEANNANG